MNRYSRTRSGAVLVFLLASLPVYGQDEAAAPPAAQAGSGIKLPADGDEYSRLVARAAAHDETLDFKALRIAYLDSAARKREAQADVSGLNAELLAAMNAYDDKSVREKAEALLSVDYTDFIMHAYLSTACKILNDMDCADQAKFVARGLLYSITDSGDGTSCATGWLVVTVHEEYALMASKSLQVSDQSLVSSPDGHQCDLLNAKDEKGDTQAYYFRLDIVWADEAKMFGPGEPPP